MRPEKVMIRSVGFSLDFKECCVSVALDGLPDPGGPNTNGIRTLDEWIPVRRGKVPAKAEIEAAARKAVRRYLRAHERDRRHRAMLAEVSAYAGHHITLAGASR
jgi:hypothetical protein